MDNLRTVLSIVLSKIPPGKILREEIRYDDITKESFIKLAGYYVNNYSNDELDNLYSYIQNEYEELADYFRGYRYNVTRTMQGRFNIFEAVLIFAIRVLQEKEGEPVCLYEHLLRWRMISHELGEDMFTTAFLAYNDIRYTNGRHYFAWRPVIRNNNVYLDKLLSQGMADNHFHLKGSAPQFPLSWISIMNNVISKKNRELICGYHEQRLSTIFYTGDADEPLYISYLKAAMIRCFLFAKLTHRRFWLKGSMGKDKQGIEDETEKMISTLLRGTDEILFYREELQENIFYFKYADGNKNEKILDYALLESTPYLEKDKNVNGILSGERWFLYAMFRSIYAKDSEMRKYYNYFYAYLVIKGTIRSELVQTNITIGFDNFERYQNRKEDFIEKTAFEDCYLKMAVRGTLLNQNIRYLEARITPRGEARSNKSYISRLEGIIDKEKELEDRYFYVFHFVKEKDQIDHSEGDLRCRHYRKRKSLRKQAQAIAQFREKYPRQASRVKGIDTCAKEIGCRPEVFAQVYRFLGNHIVNLEEKEERNILLGGKSFQKAGQLGLTYHIGEDFLDIVDGLRAIDEAVHFLKLGCGTRFGHALVLGIDVEEHYNIKKNRILISQQDYLDNLVWMYFKIKKFRLDGYESLLIFLEQEYEKYFRIVYGNYICDGMFYGTIQAARAHFRNECSNEAAAGGYCNSHFYFRMPTYYAAWKLRGDNPQCYRNGYFEEIDEKTEWNRYSVNRTYPLDYKSRYNAECAYLYYLYHYCSAAKEEGQRVVEVKVDHQFVQCAKELQLKMRDWVAKKGVGIETNPSSNYLISSFRRYDKHPIFDFYNLGLTAKWEELENCPQMLVCINTDDQGIFSTYLENEYALLALALEKSLDENGEHKYNRSMIYQWINNVREMGINLSFGQSDSYLNNKRNMD